jgi:hypothetical protein
MGRIALQYSVRPKHDVLRIRLRGECQRYCHFSILSIADEKQTFQLEPGSSLCRVAKNNIPNKLPYYGELVTGHLTK